MDTFLEPDVVNVRGNKSGPSGDYGREEGGRRRVPRVSTRRAQRDGAESRSSVRDEEFHSPEPSGIKRKVKQGRRALCALCGSHAPCNN
jgi:hypothetical protein